MSETLKAIILGIIQGLTEFLPVSSSGHLELGKSILGIEFQGNESLAFTVWLHLATALSTIVFFRKSIFKIFKDSFSSNKSEQKTSLKYIGFIALSMLPAGIVGLLFEDEIDEFFYGNIGLVSLCLLFTGALLFFAQKAKDKTGELNTKNAFLIGLAQAIALLPGISRSGSTIASALILGVKREEAAKFSFLMVLPLILAKVGKDVLEAIMANDFAALSLTGDTMLAFVFAFATGLLACKWMISLVKKLKLYGFAAYCALVGVIGLIFSFI